ncbi:MAG: hypothetical protein NVSMB25_03060 [Thermoleophilaceae bacterium]
MLAESRSRIEASLSEDDLVLDVGAWAQPFDRADWVIDLLPHESRGLYGYDRAGASERFSAATWVQRDICDHVPWPFADRQFDFAICSHTLEDVRDPVWVCHELQRVARAGYIEVPSRLEEQSYGVQGPWVGWGHHHWLIDVRDSEIDFVFKHHVLHGRASDHFPEGFGRSLDTRSRVQTLWWEGRFRARERIFTGAGEIDAYLADFVARRHPPSRRGLRSRLARG